MGFHTGTVRLCVFFFSFLFFFLFTITYSSVCCFVRAVYDSVVRKMLVSVQEGMGRAEQGKAGQGEVHTKTDRRRRFPTGFQCKMEGEEEIWRSSGDCTSAGWSTRPVSRHTHPRMQEWREGVEGKGLGMVDIAGQLAVDGEKLFQ